MKSTDKFVLVLVASLALLLAGCGGGSSTTEEPTDPPAVDPAVAERAAISSAIMMARTAVSGIDNDSTDTEVSAADTAIASARRAIANAANVPAAEKAANTTTVDTLASQLSSAKMARSEAMDAADKAAAETMAKVGKALKAALGNTPLSNLDLATNAASLTSAGLAVGLSAGPGGTPAAALSPRMKAGASAGSLGDWAGKHYSHTNAGTKVTNSAVVYTNQGASTVKPFATGASFGADQAAFDAAYTASTRTLALGDPVATTDIKGDDFPTAGETTYTPDPLTGAVVIPGTYQGAPGNYRCSGTCTAALEGGGLNLGGTWVFIHDSGAMTSKPDANYLFFGWWLQKDKDGEPTSASAFTGVAGQIGALSDPTQITGSATYNGHAAGKFAISDPLSGGDGGHFTAEATLTAKFGDANTAGNGISGTLENFMANEKAVPWSVSLLHADLSATGGTVPVDDLDTATVDESMDMTVWSIDGNSGTASGTWSGQLYDESATDGSNVATSVTGLFQSQFGLTHTMVGAFGAEKE